MDLVAEVAQRIMCGCKSKAHGGAGTGWPAAIGSPRARAIAPFNASIQRNYHCALRGLRPNQKSIESDPIDFLLIFLILHYRPCIPMADKILYVGRREGTVVI